MATKAPVHYRVEFYDGPISGKEVLNYFEPPDASYPFMVGDFIDPFGWGGKNKLAQTEHYEITAVEHQLSFVDTPESQTIQHNIVISLKAVPRIEV
ncbi:MAG TPA: hypothetical protein VEG60_32260 [Candidatus Binatia bacterium]|nr:hypothetical protein [Candidatus Binatia bacterium]